jgi:hypothetical protein
VNRDLLYLLGHLVFLWIVSIEQCVATNTTAAMILTDLSVARR